MAAVWDLILVRPRRESLSTVSVVGRGARSASVSHRSWLRPSAHLFLAIREEALERASKLCCPSGRTAVESCIKCTNPMVISAFGAELSEQWTQGCHVDVWPDQRQRSHARRREFLHLLQLP